MNRSISTESSTSIYIINLSIFLCLLVRLRYSKHSKALFAVHVYYLEIFQCTNQIPSQINLNSQLT